MSTFFVISDVAV